MKHSIIIPYQHSEERLPLLYACLEKLTSLYNFEICIHEVGSESNLNLSSKYKYLFTEYSGVFHRAWVINRGVKELATGDMLILMDADLIITPEWIREIIPCRKLSIGWGRLSSLNDEGTAKYLKTKYIDKDLIERTRTPSMGSAAGGAMIIPSNLFHKIKGIPEDFFGTWGGEDNAFWAKLKSFGYEIGKLTSEIFHLNHSPSTPRIREVQRKIFPMLHWNTSQWKEYNRVIGDGWGAENSDFLDLPSIEYISSIEGPKLTLAMLSWLRYDKLINTLTSHLETITVPVNLVLMVQGVEKLNKDQKRNIRELADEFDGTDIFFTQGNIGTGPARKILLARALRRFYTPYINLSDDDTTYIDGAIESALDLLDDDPTIGVVGIRHKSKIFKLDSYLNPTTFNASDAEENIEYVDAVGSATAIIRREIFDLCNIDPTYIVGEWDIDLFLQARSVGWKIVNYKTVSEEGAINDWGGSNEYKRARMNRKEINNSVKYFKEKWGLNRAL